MTGLLKPPMWAISPALVAPEWRWFWAKAVSAFPVWDNSLYVTDVSVGGGSHLIDSADCSIVVDRIGPGVSEPLTAVRPSAANLRTSFTYPVTVMAVMKLNTAFGSGNRLVFQLESSGGLPDIRKIGIGFNNSNQVVAFVRLGFTDVILTDTTGTHLSEIILAAIVSRTSTDHELFVNGVSVATSSTDSESVSSWNQVRFYGGRGPSTCFLGGGFNVAFTNHQLAALARDPFGPFRMADDVALWSTAAGIVGSGILDSIALERPRLVA